MSCAVLCYAFEFAVSRAQRIAATPQSPERGVHAAELRKELRQPIRPISMTEVRQHVYWIEFVAHDSKRSPLSADLYEAPADLSTSRVIARLTMVAEASPSALAMARLVQYRGVAYLVFPESTVAIDPASPGAAQRWRQGQANTCLYALSPDPRSPLQKVSLLPPLPKKLFFDGPYCYIRVDEEPDNWLDWSAQGLRRSTVHALYRLRLPYGPG